MVERLCCLGAIILPRLRNNDSSSNGAAPLLAWRQQRQWWRDERWLPGAINLHPALASMPAVVMAHGLSCWSLLGGSCGERGLVTMVP
jgi:hypothetical protein